MKRLLACLVLSTAAVSVLHPAVSLADPQDSAGLTLADAVSEALRSNHDVLRSREQLAQLGGQIQEVKSAVYPQLGLETSYRRRYDESVLDSLEGVVEPEVDNNYAIRTTVNQLLFSWGKVSTAVEIAKDSLVQGKYDVGSTEREVKLRVHEAFYGLLLAYRLVEVAEATLEQRKRQLDVAEKRFEAGVVNEFEVIRARVDVANTKIPVIRTRNDVRQAGDLLNNLLARPQGSPVELIGELEYVPIKGLTLAAVVDRAIRQRPELASLRVGREIAEKTVKIARAEDKLEVNLQAEYGYATEQFENLNAKRERWGAGVVFSLPLFDGWRTRGRVAQAWSEMRDVEIALNQLRDNITLEAKAALDLLEAAEEGINATSLNIGQAETALELAETSYQYGVATFLDVTDAQLSLAIARRDHAEALQVYMVAKARVLSAMNEL
jgi:HAE1 family hydrophobic/amphiphilic exporter-1